MRKILLLPIFTALLVFSIGSSNAYASSSYEIGPNDPNQSCEKLGGSFVSGFRFECDVGTNATLSAGDTITIDPFSRLNIFNGATLDVNGGTITIRSGTVFGNLATSGGTVIIRNGGTIDVFGSIAVFQGAVINEAGGTVVNTGGTIAINGGAFINECGTLINNGQIVNGQVQNECFTTTTLSSLLNPSASGQPVEFTAIVSPSSGSIPDGETVTFYENGTPIGTGSTSGGSAAFTVSFANAGSYSITATYPGDSNFPSSTSNEVIQDVTNTPPVANPDSYTVNENTALSVSTATGVLANDNDPDGDILTASLVTDTSHGTMTLHPDGSFTYTPNSDFAGSDSFVYQANDGHGHTASTTDAITVNQIVCPAGSFLSLGANTCTLAPPGSYVPSPGATSSTLCPAGTFTDLLGQSSCTLSPAGSFVNTTGATSATQCDAGTFQPLTGQSSCLLAQPGFFVNSTGAIQQTQCPAGTDSTAGAISCYIVDTTPPAVSITQPSDGSVLNHISSINGTASDDTSISSVLVSIDGGLPTHATYSSGTWTLAATLSNGTHTVNATATDSVGLEAKTGIIHFTILTPTQGRITGGGHVGQDQNFGFEVKSDSDSKKTTSGHIEYHDKSQKIDLDSNQITILSVYDSSTHAAFVGQGTIHDKDKTLYNLLVQVSDPDKSGDHDMISIMITDKTGAVVYQNSGIVHGHIEIHKFSDHDDKSDSGNQHGNNSNNDSHNNSH
jgi:Bacterial Ig domain/Tyrosine-protein kinase ephrin type A/B receptor-like